MSIASQKAIKNSALKLFARDTVELSDDFVTRPDKFIKKVNKYAEESVLRKQTGSYIMMLPVRSGKTTTIVPVTQYTYTDRFIKSSVKPLIKNEIFAGKKDKLYVPVEYYGTPNPDPKLK